jgi:DNA replication protein DnaC
MLTVLDPLTCRVLVKSHLSAAIGLAPFENGWRVLFCRATDLVQKARRDLALEGAIAKLTA